MPSSKRTASAALILTHTVAATQAQAMSMLADPAVTAVVARLQPPGENAAKDPADRAPRRAAGDPATAAIAAAAETALKQAAAGRAGATAAAAGGGGGGRSRQSSVVKVVVPARRYTPSLTARIENPPHRPTNNMRALAALPRRRTMEIRVSRSGLSKPPVNWTWPSNQEAILA